MFTFPHGAKFIFQLYACNLFEIYVVILQITFFTVILPRMLAFRKNINTEIICQRLHRLASLRCFDTFERDAIGNGKLFSIVRLENDRQCQFIIVSAYISVAVSVTCLLSIQISSVKHWTDIELRD